MKRNHPQDVWKYIDVRGLDECWPWNGRITTVKNGQGYGYIGIGRKCYMAHRVVFWLLNQNSIEL